MYCKYRLAHKILGILSEPQLQTLDRTINLNTITFTLKYLIQKTKKKEIKVIQALTILSQLKFIEIEYLDDKINIHAKSSGVSAYCECYFIEKANVTSSQKWSRILTYISLPLSVLASLLVTIDKCKSNDARSNPPQTQLEYKVPPLSISK